MNATTLAIEKGYPARTELEEQYCSWDVSLPDSVVYGVPVTNLSESHGTVIEKLARSGFRASSDEHVVELSRMSNAEVKMYHGEDFADALKRLRCPLGRTGLNGVGIFYEAGESLASDLVVIHNNDGKLEVPLVYSRGRWNTPGGFREPIDQNGQATALREFEEEVGHAIDVPITSVINEVKTSDRTTDHGWMRVELHAAQTEIRFALTAGDDAERAEWFPVAGLSGMVRDKQLSKTKLHYITEAVKTLGL